MNIDKWGNNRIDPSFYICQECRQELEVSEMAVVRPVTKCHECIQAHEMVLAENPFDTDEGRARLNFND